MSINRAIISGRLCADPEIKRTNSGVEVLTITVAVDRNYKNETGEYDADFINVVAWRGTALFIGSHFRKGDKIEVDGKIQSRTWKDKYEQNRTTLEIVADSVDFGGTKKGAENPERDATSIQIGEFKVLDESEDVPF